MEDLEKFGIYHETYLRLMRMKIVDMSRLGDLVTGPKTLFLCPGGRVAHASGRVVLG